MPFFLSFLPHQKSNDVSHTVSHWRGGRLHVLLLQRGGTLMIDSLAIAIPTRVCVYVLHQWLHS